jgi:Rrf2 family iron-sulfur cluster assembly transcriptional regulator
MILTTKARYAVMAIIEIADRGQGNPISLLTISQNQNISLSYLEQIFADLKKSGLVKAVRGPGGGYVLGKKSQDLNIAEIIKAMGESIKMTRCKDKKGCMPDGTQCKTHHLWKGLENNIFGYLNSISIGDICK